MNVCLTQILDHENDGRSTTRSSRSPNIYSGYFRYASSHGADLVTANTH